MSSPVGVAHEGRCTRVALPGSTRFLLLVLVLLRLLRLLLLLGDVLHVLIVVLVVLVRFELGRLSLGARSSELLLELGLEIEHVLVRVEAGRRSE